MNILYVSHTHPDEESLEKSIGGMQRISHHLINELEQKESVNIVKEVINVSGKFNKLKTAAFLLKNIILLKGKAQEAKADLILFSSLTTAIIAKFVRSRISVPMITIAHGRDVIRLGLIYQTLVVKALEHLDGIISVSRATQYECEKRGMKSDKGIVVPNGISQDNLITQNQSTAEENEFEKILGVSTAEKKILLTVGRLVKRKGHEWFLRNVLPGIASDVIYVVIGDGPEKTRIKKTVKEMSLEESVVLLGYQPDEILKNAYAAVDVFVMPNIPVEGDMEGFGIVLLEANLAGTPAVASDLEGIRDVVTDGQNGFKIPALHAKNFARRIDELLKSDSQDFSRRTKSFVEAKFDWGSVSRRYFNFFESILQR